MPKLPEFIQPLLLYFMNIYEKFFYSYYDDHKDFLLRFYQGPLKMTAENYHNLVMQKTALQNSDFDRIEKKIVQFFKRIVIPRCC